MNENRATDIGSFEVLVANREVETVESAADEDNPDELSGSNLAENSAEGDHHGGGVEISVEQFGNGETDLLEDLAANDGFPEGLVQDGPLQNQGGGEEVEADGGEGVLGSEGHEKAETDEDHDVNILIHGVSTIEFCLGALGAEVIEVIFEEDSVEDDDDGLPDQGSEGEGIRRQGRFGSACNHVAL